MIAEDCFASSDAGEIDRNTSRGRHNRNLSSIVSTIRDDGPSVANEAGTVQDVMPEQPQRAGIPTADAQPRIRALPGKTVFLKVAAVLLLATLIGVVAILSTGRYPVLSKQGLQLASLPVETVSEIAAIKTGFMDSISDWPDRIKAVFSTVPQQDAGLPFSSSSDLSAIAENQHGIQQQLADLATNFGLLQQRFEQDQAARLADSNMQSAEQSVRLDALQAQVAGLQQQLDEYRNEQLRAPAEKSPVAASQKPVAAAKQQAQPGTWVVNVAASSREGPIKSLQRKLQKQDIETELQQLGSGEKIRYRLRVTGFTSGGEAKRYAKKLVEESGIEGAWASKK